MCSGAQRAGDVATRVCMSVGHGGRATRRVCMCVCVCACVCVCVRACVCGASHVKLFSSGACGTAFRDWSRIRSTLQCLSCPPAAAPSDSAALVSLLTTSATLAHLPRVPRPLLLHSLRGATRCTATRSGRWCHRRWRSSSRRPSPLRWPRPWRASTRPSASRCSGCWADRPPFSAVGGAAIGCGGGVWAHLSEETAVHGQEGWR